MRPYDPTRLLVSIHVPRCAGTSLGMWLAKVFPERLHLHYPDTAPPECLQYSAGWCVHGHFFHHVWDIGAHSYYPQSDQFITVLRDPLQMMISSYRYQCGIGHAPAADLNTYLKHVLSWPRLFVYQNLPFDIAAPDAWAWVERHFVWIGVLDHLELTLPVLAYRLGASTFPIPAHLNTSRPEDTVLDIPKWNRRFRQKFPCAYALYDKAYAYSDQMREEMRG